VSGSIAIDPVFGCETWRGRTTPTGYGRDGSQGAHVTAWVAAYGPVPEGFVLDHTCRNRACLALHHLEAVTQGENLKRREWKYRAKRKKCAKGHELERGNRVITPFGGVVCRLCNAEAKERAA
jgi:hypothetical protein